MLLSRRPVFFPISTLYLRSNRTTFPERVVAVMLGHETPGKEIAIVLREASAYCGYALC